MPLLPSIPLPRFAVQIIFHKENPGIDYEFYVPVEKKEEERERPKDREREAPRNTPREKPRQREQARASLRSEYTLGFSPFCLAAVSENTPETDAGGVRRDTNRWREVLASVNNKEVSVGDAASVAPVVELVARLKT